MDEQTLAAMQQAGAGAFAPPTGMGAPTVPPPPALPPGADGEMVPVEAPELETDTPDEVDDELGSGPRPRQSGATVRRREHPLDRAAQTISAEIHGNASRLARDLFPSGPAGSERLSKPAFNAYVLRHWEEPEFRQSLLERLAPKGPDGKRLNSGVKAFNSLYKDVVAPGQRIKEVTSAEAPVAFVPPGQANPEPAPPESMGGLPPAPPTGLGPPPPPSGLPPSAPPPPAPPGAAPAGLPGATAAMPTPAPLPPMAPLAPPPMPPGPDAGFPPPPGPNVLPPG